MRIVVNDDIDLEQTAESGQCFRWEQTGDREYRIIHKENCLYISQEDSGELLLDCREEEYETVWRDYFDLDTDYREIRRLIDPESDPFLHMAAKEEQGIRILRQDPWEIAVSFIISQNRSIPIIRRSVAQLCRLAGERYTDKRGEAYHSFPGPEAVLSMTDEELAKCRLGYREKYVLAAARAANDGVFLPERFERLPDMELLRELGTLYGVGPKVASCIALYGFHRLDAFPVDTWIRKALENEYPEGFPFDRYRPYNGVFQQYVFAFYRRAAACKSS